MTRFTSGQTRWKPVRKATHQPDLRTSIRPHFIQSSIHAPQPCQREQWTLRAWQDTKALLFALLRFLAANQLHCTCPYTFVHCNLCLDQVSTVLQIVLPLTHHKRITTTTTLDETGTCLQRRAPSAKPPKNLLLSMEEKPTSRLRTARLGRDGWKWSPSLSVTFYTHITVIIY